MLKPAAPLSHSGPCSHRKAETPRQPLARSWLQERSARESGGLGGEVGASKGSRNKAAGRSQCHGGSLPVCWVKWQQPHHDPQKIRLGIAGHKGRENTPISALSSPVNVQKHSQQGIYSIFTPRVPSNGSCIMFHTEGNYLLNFLCTGGVNALIFCRCLGHIPHNCFDLKWGVHSCFTGLLWNKVGLYLWAKLKSFIPSFKQRCIQYILTSPQHKQDLLQWNWFNTKTFLLLVTRILMAQDFTAKDQEAASASLRTRHPCTISWKGRQKTQAPPAP